MIDVRNVVATAVDIVHQHTNRHRKVSMSQLKVLWFEKMDDGSWVALVKADVEHTVYRAGYDAPNDDLYVDVLKRVMARRYY